MDIFSWLPQRRPAHVMFDLFGDRDSPASDLPPAPTAASDPPPADQPAAVARLMPGLAVLGAISVAGLAALWGSNLAVLSPSATVTLPPPRQVAHASPRPLAAPRPAPAASPREQVVPAAVAVHAPAAPATVREQRRLEQARHPNAVAVPVVLASEGSRYTSLEPAACTTIRAANTPLRRCPGVAGYALETRDARPTDHFAILGPGGRSELEFSQIAPGGSLGKLAEWRAPGGGKPRALIVRVSLQGKRAVSSLIVAKLDPSPCVVAVIPRGARQNEKARSVADREQLNCLASEPS